MKPHKVVSREEWLQARAQHLAREKEFTRLRDAAALERPMAWLRHRDRYES